MKLQKRILSLLLVACMAIPMLLISVSADETTKIEPVSYDLFCDELKGLNYGTKGTVALKKAKDLLNDLYASGTLKAIPYAVSSSSSAYINCAEKDTASEEASVFEFDGLKQQKVKTGDWAAIKFKSPGEGAFSVYLKHYYHNQNNAAWLNAYLLPGNTAENQIGSLLTESNKIGDVDILTDTVLKSQNVLRLSVSAEMKAGKDYILVVQINEDLYKPDDDRIDFCLTGVEFREATVGAGGFNPIRGKIAYSDAVLTAQFYRALNGVNPANGHDMLYLMFKGGDLLVYDVDTAQIVDKQELHHSQTKGTVITPDGHLWAAGGMNIIEYDPATKTKTRHILKKDMVGGIAHECNGLVYGDDGMLYFGYYGWVLSLNPKTGEFKNISGTQLTSKPELKSDAQFVGAGGMVYNDGYLYFGIFGDLNGDQKFTGELVKFDIAQGKAVQFIDVIKSFRGEKYQANYGFSALTLMDGILYGSFNGRPDEPVLVDVTGDQMVRLDSVPGLDTDLISGFSAELDGKYYVSAYVDREENTKCLYEYDPATKVFTRLSDIYYTSTLSLKGQGIVTIENDEQLPGKTLMTVQNNSATGEVDIVFYNMQTRETAFRIGITAGHGTGVSLTGFEMDPTGRYLYTGGYGCNKLGIVDLVTGEVVNHVTVGHQIDGIVWYKDDVWTGNYFDGIINRFDPEYNEANAICYTLDAVFANRRMLNPISGDGKVFYAGVPDNGRTGGVLAWYDIERDMTYIATGPEKKDVYYAQTTASFVVWRNAETHEIETFDLDGDSNYDKDIIIDDKGDSDPSNDILAQHTYGVFKDRVISTMCYVDGYIYGGTTKDGGNNVFHEEGNAQIFVYDVVNMKLVAEYDLTQSLVDIEDEASGTVKWIENVTADPYEKGKFWGTVCDTLFSFTFDFDTLTFHVKEEVSFGKNVNYRSLGNSKIGTTIYFDGDYVYVPFENAGTYMINTANPSEYNQISATSAEKIERAADGNLYYITDRGGNDKAIQVWEAAQYTQPLVIKSVQAVIDALPDVMTLENEAQFMDAYNMYMDLIETSRAQVVADKLLTAMGLAEIDQAAKADQLIDAIGTVTLESERAILTARRYYEGLTETAKAKVTKLSVLEAAELTLIELKDAQKPAPKTEPNAGGNEGGNNTILFVAVGAAVLIAAVVVVVLLTRKKKPSAGEKTEE